MEQADNLIRKLQESSNFYIVIEGDSLLKTEAETLSEAFESANNAVFLSISMISAMTSVSDGVVFITVTSASVLDKSERAQFRAKTYNSYSPYCWVRK
ncbi:protein ACCUMULATION AND REPLICATION OF CHLOROPLASTS 3 [Carex littledalei]|uniref:Protein ACCUMULATION AND REPLICATION OF CHLOROPLASTS 3 n=1 Tax=Carex littledalei TaxID=544730 RepID=A0A833QRL4_9POAL|nr:protein ACCUMULATION AND REPLICATION OF CHLOROPLASTS 3 [Carex littledalei]